MQFRYPPNPVVLKRIYPWEEYNIDIVLQWLYAQATKTGFTGSFEDFKQRYGAYIEATDPETIYDIIDNYTGAYHITPLVSITQVLQTKNKVLNENIIIDPIPDDVINPYKMYTGNYVVTPIAHVDQLLRTKNKVLTEEVVVGKIPYAEVSNLAGGTTVTIG